MIDNYLAKFNEMTGITEPIISTVDHVYASIPVRLIDSHYILFQKGNVKILIWDDIYPKLKRSRTELVLDCGIFNASKVDYFLFPPDKIYGTSYVLKPDFQKQIEELSVCLDLVLNFPKNKKFIVKKAYLERFKTISDLYRKVLSNSNKERCSSFYKNLVVETYNLLGFSDLANFYNKSAQSFMNTGIINKFLPWLIENTINTSFSLLYLINNSFLFPPPYFRYINSDKTIDSLKTIENVNKVNVLLREGVLLPSKEVMYWLFAVTNIKHFGRDFNFFNQLEDFYKSNLNIENNFSDLQLTSGKDDGTFYIQYDNDFSYRLIDIGNKIKAKRCSIPRKNTDISTIPSIYMHIGNCFKEIYEQYLQSKNICFIKMGEIKI